VRNASTGKHIGPLSTHFAAFADRLSREGHSPPSRWCNISLFRHFNQWLDRNRIRLASLDEATVERYWTFRVRHRNIVPADRPALNRLLAVLREADAIPPKPPLAIGVTEQLIKRFEQYLFRCGGYSRRSVLAHGPTLRRFLAECCPRGATGTRLKKLTALEVADYVTRRAAGQSAKTTQHVCWTLRSFLRFLRLEDLIVDDLASTVPSVKCWRFSSLPRFLLPEQVSKVLAAVDRSTAVGRRNYAVLMLLARLGLRASEVATLCIDDIDWHSGELTVRAKGRQRARMPLPRDVGSAIADYLQQGRPHSDSRRVFLRSLAPHIGFSSGTNVTVIACSALATAGVEAPCKGAHVFRHSLATHLLRAGATLGEVGQVLRHRAADSTRIYAKVDVGALRRLSMPWPGSVQ